MQPSPQDARAITTYEALMWAMARPGLPRPLPLAGEEPLIEALIDRECAVWCADETLSSYASRTGAVLVEPRRADHVFAGALEGVDPLGQLKCGSDLYPDEGATLVLRGDLAQGPRVILTGPGIDDHITVTIGGLPDGFWAARARAFRYPMGFEIFVLDGAQVLGIPRSTKVEAR